VSPYALRIVLYISECQSLLRGLPPNREEVCVPQWPGELCWQEYKLLVWPPMPNGTRRRKCSHWSSLLGVERWDNEPTPLKFTVTKPWGRPRPTRWCGASKLEVEENHLYSLYEQMMRQTLCDPVRPVITHKTQVVEVSDKVPFHCCCLATYSLSPSWQGWQAYKL
jgi:hypothetical protein